ncbi:sensitivity to red-light reduced protein [Asimina triloba]
MPPAAAITPDGWTVVLPRWSKRRRQKSQIPKSPPSSRIPTPIPWTPAIQTDPINISDESKLLHKIHISLQKLQSSQFYHALAALLRSPQTLASLSRALSSHPNMLMPMVVYGIGSIGSHYPPRLQLALAILLRRNFDWIGDVQVFDPVISAAEARVMASLGCPVLSVDEQARRVVDRPTLFFMPHCEAALYDNLIEANWAPERLNRMVVFGNSFGRYERFALEFGDSEIAASARHVLGVRRFVEEVGVEMVEEDFYRAFNETSWHFFNLDPGMDMGGVKLGHPIAADNNSIQGV